MMSLFRLLTLLCFASTAQSSDFSQTDVRNNFEQRLAKQIENALNPLLGKDSYIINFQIKELNLKSQKAPVFFSKLGISTELPSLENPKDIPLEKWIDHVTLEISISDELKNFDETFVNAKIDKVFASLGKIKYSTNLTRFSPAASTKNSWTRSIPWTPIAIVLGGLMLCFAFFGISNSISNLKLVVPAPEQKSMSFEQEFSPHPEEKSNNLSSDGNSDSGSTKWLEVLKLDITTARLFVQELTCSHESDDSVILDYILKNTPIADLKKVLQDVPKDITRKIYSLALRTSEPYTKGTAENLLQLRLHHFLLGQMMDQNHILKAIHDFSIEESIEVVKKWPELLSTFVEHFSSVQMEKIFSAIDPQLLTHFFSQKQNQIESHKLVTQAREHIEKIRAEQARFSESVNLKILLAASHIEESREKALFLAALPQLSHTEITHAASESFPQFLMKELPPSVIKPVLLSYPLKERAQLLISFDSEQRSHYLNFLRDDGKVYEILEAEIEEISSSKQRSQTILIEAPKAKKDFSSRVRRYLNSSVDLKTQGKSVIEKWVGTHKGFQSEKSAA